MVEFLERTVVAVDAGIAVSVDYVREWNCPASVVMPTRPLRLLYPSCHTTCGSAAQRAAWETMTFSRQSRNPRREGGKLLTVVAAILGLAVATFTALLRRARA